MIICYLYLRDKILIYFIYIYRNKGSNNYDIYNNKYINKDIRRMKMR